MSAADGESTRTHNGPTGGASAAGRRRRAYLLVFIAALAVRGGLGAALGLQRGWDERSLLLPDEQQYWAMARSLHEGGQGEDELGFVATRMPLFTRVLAAFVAFDGGLIWFRLLLWIVGAITATCAAGLAGATVGERAILPAGLLVAFDPYLAFFSSLVLTETVAIAALVAFWWRLALMLPGAAGHDGACLVHGPSTCEPCRRRWIVVAALAALCVHTRESNLAFVGAALAYVLIAYRFQWYALRGAIVVVLVIVAALFPWALRNASVTGDWCWLTHRGGITLYDGVHAGATGASDLGAIKAMPEVHPFIEAGDEAGWDRYFTQQALAAMRADPIRIIRLAVAKLARTWNVFPNVQDGQRPALRWVSAGWTVPVYGLALAGALTLARRRRVGAMMDENGARSIPPTSAAGSTPAAAPRDAASAPPARPGYLLLPVLVVCLLHSVFVGSVRYRLPAMPMVEVLAAAGCVAALGRFTGVEIDTTTPKDGPTS
ncbi:MAG: hypothetical protein C4547_16445 [Phycisphaerales bacterium]|nr:MAG: hypothetical protein C4547_16445 [Phycisphaerales bacterium]